MYSIITDLGDKCVSRSQGKLVSLFAYDGQNRAYLDLTPEEAEQIAAGLLQAAAEARDAAV